MYTSETKKADCTLPPRIKWCISSPVYVSLYSVELRRSTQWKMRLPVLDSSGQPSSERDNESQSTTAKTQSKWTVPEDRRSKSLRLAHKHLAELERQSSPAENIKQVPKIHKNPQRQRHSSPLNRHQKLTMSFRSIKTPFFLPIPRKERSSGRDIGNNKHELQLKKQLRTDLHLRRKSKRTILHVLPMVSHSKWLIQLRVFLCRQSWLRHHSETSLNRTLSELSSKTRVLARRSIKLTHFLQPREVFMLIFNQKQLLTSLHRTLAPSGPFLDSLQVVEDLKLTKTQVVPSVMARVGQKHRRSALRTKQNSLIMVVTARTDRLLRLRLQIAAKIDRNNRGWRLLLLLVFT